VSAAILLGGATATWGAGCSSSTSPPPAALDSGTTRDASPSDTGAPPRDSSAADSSVRDSASQDSASQDSASQDSSAGSGDAAPPCPPTSTSTFKPAAYTNATEHQGVCGASATAAFVAACGSAGTPSTCDAWEAANVASDAGAGNACGNCVVAPLNNGGAWADPRGALSPNYGACVQILDPNGGSTCAAAFDDAIGCEGIACDTCPAATRPACVKATDMGSCSTFAGAKGIACAPLQSFLGMCQPSNVTGNPDDDLTFIVGLVCGEAGDGGTADSGAADTGAGHD
jgi:hypothetical protein